MPPPRPQFFSARCFRLTRPNAAPRIPRRTLIAAPKPDSGPLLTRSADRELPSPSSRFRWMRTIPLFALIIGGSAAGIFNYQKSSSSVVSGTLYSLRVNENAREALGDEIYFRDRMPWIWGEMNQLHGRINIQFGVKGTKRKGIMRFRSERKTRRGYFTTLEWSLTLDDGTYINLLEEDQPDPFKNLEPEAEMLA